MVLLVQVVEILVKLNKVLIIVFVLKDMFIIIMLSIGKIIE